MTGRLKLLPLDEWPEADRVAWAHAVQPGDRFEDGGPAARWAERSRRTVLYGYRRWLGHLDAAEPMVLSQDPESRINPEALGRYLEILNDTITPAGTFNYIKHLYDAARVMWPDQAWGWLHDLACRLEKHVSPRNKRPRMVSSHELSGLGHNLMEEAETVEGLRPLERAILYRDGLMIALLAARPLRRRNLAGIRIGKNLITGPDGFWLIFAENETKTHTALEFSIPADLVPCLENYLDHYRLLFPRADHHDHLWASAKGRPMGEQAIYQRIVLHTGRAFGKSVNPHLFRDCVATTIAIEDPAHVGIAAQLLGHASLEFTQQHYIQAETLEACRSYQTGLQALRDKLSAAEHRTRDHGKE